VQRGCLLVMGAHGPNRRGSETTGDPRRSRGHRFRCRPTGTRSQSVDRGLPLQQARRGCSCAVGVHGVNRPNWWARMPGPRRSRGNRSRCRPTETHWRWAGGRQTVAWARRGSSCAMEAAPSGVQRPRMWAQTLLALLSAKGPPFRCQPTETCWLSAERVTAATQERHGCSCEVSTASGVNWTTS
jgi:hypothetical protein